MFSLALKYGVHSLTRAHVRPSSERGRLIEIPWEIQSLDADFVTSKTGGIFDLSFWELVRFEGPDSADFLHRMSTVNFKSFPDLKTAPGCFLNHKSGVLTFGFFERVGNVFHYWVPPGMGATTVEHVERFHFSESFTVTLSEDYVVLGVWNRHLVQLKLADNVMSSAAEWKDPWRDGLTWLRLRTRDLEQVIQDFRAQDIPWLGHALFEFYRIEAGLAQPGVEIDEKSLILEASLDKAVEENKGCYPGQEVVERIRSYGRVNRQIRSVLGMADDVAVTVPGLPAEILSTAEGAAASVGQLLTVSSCPESWNPSKMGQSPARFVGLAMLNRKAWSDDSLRLSTGHRVMAKPD